MKSKTEYIFISSLFAESIYYRAVRTRTLPGVMIEEEKKKEEKEEANGK